MGAVAALCLLTLVCETAFAQAGAAIEEYKLKAVVLLKLARFVDWPTNTFATAKSPLVIGVLGQDPFGTYLDNTVRSETVDERPILVIRSQQLRDMQKCHVVFVSRSETAQLPGIIEELRKYPILTVSDISRFAHQGGLVGFIARGRKVKFQINQKNVTGARLKISSQVLQLAEIVDGKAGEER